MSSFLCFLDFLLKNMNCASEAEESHSVMENLNHTKAIGRVKATILLLS